MIGHWGLEQNPFTGRDSTYVSLPSHDEAVARLVYAIESSQPRAILVAPAGSGKSAVLRQAFRQARSPHRRLVSVNDPGNGDLLLAILAERLGRPPGREPSRLIAWRALERSLRVFSLEGVQVVLAIDDCNRTPGAAGSFQVDSLELLGSTLHQRFTVIQLARSMHEHRSEATDPWSFAINLRALTRTQTEHFLTAKLAGVGAAGPLFTPRAITRLHSLSSGIPSKVEHLATDCLVAGAIRGLAIVPPELVDEVARQCSADLIGAGDRS